MKVLRLLILVAVAVACCGATIVVRGPVRASAAGGPTTLATDDFNRANASPLAGNWTTQTGDTAMAIVSNAATYSNVSTDDAAYYNAVTPANDQYAQAKITTSTTGVNPDSGFGVTVRASISARTYYRALVNGDGDVELARQVAGTYTSIWQRSVTYVAGSVLRMEVQGTTLKVFYNGVQVGANATDANIASGRAGIMYSSTATSGSIDDWECGNL